MSIPSRGGGSGGEGSPAMSDLDLEGVDRGPWFSMKNSGLFRRPFLAFRGDDEFGTGDLDRAVLEGSHLIPFRMLVDDVLLALRKSGVSEFF